MGLAPVPARPTAGAAAGGAGRLALVDEDERAEATGGAARAFDFRRLAFSS